MSTVSYGGLQLTSGVRYDVRILDLYNPGLPNVYGYSDGLFLMGGAFKNARIVTWSVTHMGDGAFSLQASDGKWLAAGPSTVLSTTTNQTEASRFVASSAGAPNIGILRIAGEDDGLNQFCGVTNYYQIYKAVPDVNMFGEQYSKNGVLLPGKYGEQFFARLTPKKFGITGSPSLLFGDAAKNSSGTKFRLLFTPAP